MEHRTRKAGEANTDVKTGHGGIRECGIHDPVSAIA